MTTAATPPPPPAADAADAVSPSGAAPGYHPHRTLPFTVEARRQLRRRRTLVVALVLVALPVVIWAAFAVRGGPGPDNGQTTFITTATASGADFTAAVLFVSAGFLLVVPVALFCGDTVASEASWSSLRYLLAAPVPRARLLSAKLSVALAFSAAAIVLLPLLGLAVGTAAYGTGALQLPTGGSIGAGTALGRLAIATGYVAVTQLVTAAVGFWLSTVTDAPLGAVGGAVGVTVLGNVLDQVTALGSWRKALPAHWLYSWADALQPHLDWSGMAQGASVSVSYALVFTALAYRRFLRKDIVS